MKPQISIGMIGFGTVGAGTLRVLLENKAEIERKVGSRLDVIQIADLDITSERPVQFDKSILTTDVSKVAAWWGGKYAGANICGRVPESMFVLDIDPRNGGSQTIILSSSTTYRKEVGATAADVSVGTTVTAFGQPASSGTVNATSVMIGGFGR